VLKAGIFILALMGLSAALHGADASPAPTGDKIVWHDFSPGIFKQAQAEHRLVLLDLVAVWCHWCHVMDDQTYSDPAVIKEIREHYLAVRVDQDSRPDLSDRYGDYGWPATILFDSKGKELAKRQGFLPPREMDAMLAAFVADPTPGPSALGGPPMQSGGPAASDSASLIDLEKKFRAGYDTKAAGWGFGHKFLDWDSLLYAMDLAQDGDADAARMAVATLDAGTKLIDPVWGGADQYSTDGDWDHPHYEKLIQFQAENIDLYALASALWPDRNYLAKARAVEDYVAKFLTDPDGAFYTSQDADLSPAELGGAYSVLDDAARRKLGIPRVDTHIYARENGWMIQALVTLSNISGDPAPLKKAEQAANWIVHHRSFPGGGFTHDAVNSGGPYLGDTLEMGRAFLALYGATGDRKWLALAERAMGFIEGNFHSPSGDAGYVTSASAVGGVFTPEPLSDENVGVAQFANLLAHYSGIHRAEQIAKASLDYILSPAALRADSDWTAGPLLANRELNRAPLHTTVVGAKDDPRAQDLFKAALALPGSYKQTEWLDHREGPLPNPDVTYPDLPQPAAFLCTSTACSSPQMTPANLIALAARRHVGPLHDH
jgi:uncharacterized protein YyaL (SSP411 family)